MVRVVYPGARHSRKLIVGLASGVTVVFHDGEADVDPARLDAVLRLSGAHVHPDDLPAAPEPEPVPVPELTLVADATPAPKRARRDR